MLLRIMGREGGQRPGRREKVVYVDLFGFILTLNRLNQIWSTLRCVWRASEELVRSTFI